MELRHKKQEQSNNLLSATRPIEHQKSSLTNKTKTKCVYSFRKW